MADTTPVQLALGDNAARQLANAPREYFLNAVSTTRSRNSCA